jgi:hypothetical protein
MRSVLAAEPAAKLEYVAVANPDTMEPVEGAVTGSVALIAAKVGPVRLIDNLILGPAGASEPELIELALEGARNGEPSTPAERERTKRALQPTASDVALA